MSKKLKKETITKYNKRKKPKYLEIKLELKGTKNKLFSTNQ